MCRDFLKIKKAASGIMAVMVLIVVLVSAMFVAAETDHDCAGDDCPVCACLQQCESFLHRMGDGTVAVCAALVPYAVIVLIFTPVVLRLSRDTLVSEKVRLDN